MAEMDLPIHKILILGDGGVGKSALALQFVYGKFEENEQIPADSYRKMIVVKGKQCHVDVVDAISMTNGAEDSAGILTSHIRNGEGFLCLFRITDRSTLNTAAKLRERIRSVKGADGPIVLIGNQLDLADRREVTEQEALALASAWGVPYVETSAKTGHNVEVVFYDLAEAIAKRKDEEKRKEEKVKKSKKECVIA